MNTPIANRDPHLISPLETITQVGTSLQAPSEQRQHIEAALRNGSYVVQVGVYDGMPSAHVTIGSCEGLSVNEVGDYEPGDSWLHLTSIVGRPRNTDSNLYHGGGTYMEHSNSVIETTLPGDVVLASERPSTTVPRRTPFYETRTRPETVSGHGRGHAFHQTTQIITREQLPELLRAIVNVTNMGPETEQAYLNQMELRTAQLNEMLLQQRIGRLTVAASRTLERTIPAPAKTGVRKGWFASLVGLFS